MDSLGGSKDSGSEDEPLVPDEIDEEFLRALIEKVPEITKAVRQKDTENADNVQRLLICLNRYKSDFHMEQLRTQGLLEDIELFKARLDSAAQMSRLDQEAMSELRNVIESAWKQKDAAQTREQIAQDEVMRLRSQIEGLEESVHRLSDKSFILQTKREESEAHVKLNTEIKDLNNTLRIQRAYTLEVETMTKTLEEKNKALLKLLDESATESYNNKKRIDLLQKELNTVKANDLKSTEQIAEIKKTNEQLTKVKVRHNLQILSLKTNLEHINSQHNAAINKLAKVTIDLEYAMQERDKCKRDVAQKANLLKLREDDVIKLKQENAKLTKAHENTDRKYSMLDEEKRAVDAENIMLKTQLNVQEKEVESMRRLVDHLEKNNHNLTKERDALKRDLLQTQRTAEETNEHFQKAQHEIRSLKDDARYLKLNQQKLKESLNKLNKTKEKKLEELQNMADKIDALKNEIHLKENYAIELKRTISDIEEESAHFRTQNDALINERNGIQRLLQASEEGKIKLKQAITDLQRDIQELNDRLLCRNEEIIKQQSQLDRMEKERRLLKFELRNAKLTIQHTRAELLEKRKENDRSAKSLQEDDLNLARLKRELDVILNEKNAVFAQLTKRNDDYEQLREKLENLQTAYNQTQKHLSQCQDDVHLLSTEIKNLRSERNVLLKDRESAANLRQELLQMHRVLNQERIKARALQEEMLTPMNVHRWRTLSGKDPERMDLIKRIQALQKHILSQNVAALEQERALEESRRMYTALKEFMLKLPSYRIKEELNETQAKLCRKSKKLKSLLAELRALQADDKSKESKLQELKSQLACTMSQLLLEKKKKQKLLEERKLIAQQLQAQCFSAPPNMERVSQFCEHFEPTQTVINKDQQ